MSNPGAINIVRARGLALQAFCYGFIATMISLVPLTIFGAHISFLFLPLTVVFLWPAGADKVLSIPLLFILGLWLDFMVDGPLGLWPLIFLATFSIIRPDMRSPKSGFKSLWIGFVFWSLTTVVFILVLDVFLLQKGAKVIILLGQAIVAICIFPLVFWVRSKVRRLMNDPDSVYSQMS